MVTGSSAVSSSTTLIPGRVGHEGRGPECRLPVGFGQTHCMISTTVPRDQPRQLRPAVGADFDADRLQVVIDGVAACAAAMQAEGVTAVLHPHVGTVIEKPDEVQRILDGSSIALCLDTGHLYIGGTDPAELTRQVPDRIAHTHLKDVEATIAAKVRDGRISYSDGVRDGMYRPLGTGDVDVAAIVEHLERNGYTGWYTLEQDTILTEEPRDEGPVADVRTSAEHVRDLLAKAG